MRQIFLDTETTGLDPNEGDRIIQIAAVEAKNGLRTGAFYHTLINPLRPIGLAAMQVHQITDQMVADEPLFEEIVDDFLAFIGNDPIIIHNAEFDMNFLDSEMKRALRPLIDRNRIIDSLDVARKKFPGQHNSLDALCRRFNISLAARKAHSALLDAQLLGDVYLELMGGRQHRLDLHVGSNNTQTQEIIEDGNVERTVYPIILTDEQKENHALFLESLRKQSKNQTTVWHSLKDSKKS